MNLNGTAMRWDADMLAVLSVRDEFGGTEFVIAHGGKIVRHLSTAQSAFIKRVVLVLYNDERTKHRRSARRASGNPRR